MSIDAIAALASNEKRPIVYNCGGPLIRPTGQFQRGGTITGCERCRSTLTGVGMNKIIVSLAFGASALFATAASSAPLSNGLAVTPDNGVEQVRMVCNEYGRCWRERGRRV